MNIALITLVLLAAGGPSPDPDALVARGQRLFSAHGCYGCHVAGAFGTPIGPNLSRIGGKYPEEYLRRWLLDPQAQRPRAHMPALEVPDADARALAAWLSTLR
jgi:mono/diheme cytochrome c family protein